MKRIYHFLLNFLPRPLLIRLSYVFRIFAPILFKGSNAECSVCEKKFKKFLPYGSKVARRENVLCPYCLSLERHRLMWLYLKGKTNFFDAKLKVLHIAPEQCFYKQFRKQENLDYTTGDLFSPLADIKFDLHSIPFDENTFDVLFCNHVLEHVDDDRQCMREIFRVLKPGGYAILQVPIDNTRTETYEDSSITSPEDRELHFWQKDHVRLYGLDYPDRLREAGFTVKIEDIPNELGKEITEKYRLMKSELLYFCTK